MAIQNTFTHKTHSGETEFKDAYWEVSGFSGGDKREMLISVIIRENKESAFVIGTMNFTMRVDVAGESYRAQAYKYLMQLDKFKDSKMV